jgi:hypothetical protein
VAQEALAGLAVLAALGALVNRVALEALAVRVAPAELEPVPAAGPAKIKSVIAVHHRGLVAVPRVEDLAAVAETTREPAATEAAKAWAAAVIAVAAAAAVVVAAE